MLRIFQFSKPGHSPVPNLTDRALKLLSLYVIPIALLTASLTALFVWEDLYSSSAEKRLEFQVMQSNSWSTPADALPELKEALPRKYFDTKLSEVPVWFSFRVPEETPDLDIVEFPSRHASEMTCWDANTQEFLGYANSQGHRGAIKEIKSGYALSIKSTPTTIVCLTSFIGPARLTANLWSSDQLAISTKDFHRQSGWLDGGMVVLTIFVLVTALINRRGLYLLFAAWLLLTLRISSTSAGLDFQWLNHAVPDDLISQGRSLTRAAYAVITITLFRSLFEEALAEIPTRLPIQIASWLCLSLLPLAFLLPRSLYIYASWFVGGSALVIVSGYLIVIVSRTRSRVALWYAASMSVTFLAGLYEIFTAAFGLKEAGGAVNSVIAVLASCLLAAFAIAEQMRQEHNARLAAQAQLQHTYDAIPIGMFTLDLNGKFTSINPALRNILGVRAFKSKSNTWQQYFGAKVWHQLYSLVHEKHDGEIEIQSQMDITGNQAPRRYLVQAALAGDKIEGSLQDVTEKSEAAEELNFLADNDSLTKVLNRRGIEKAFNAAVESVDEEHPLALAYLDLDRFKLINDLYGHNAGDEVLRQVCQRINNLLSKSMYLGRVGGDEFVIVLPETRMPTATVLCRGIVDSIDDRPFRVGEKAFYVRGSIGLIEVSPGSTMKEVLSTSDRACREAKLAQHRGLVVYEKASPAYQEHQAEIQLIGEISTSEFVKGLYLEMQPIMSLSRPNEALNFEVLLRMRDVAGASVPVGRVIAAAEHSGRMSLIDRWVLTSTLAWLDAKRERLSRTQFVCVNLSGSSLNDEQFMNEVFDILGRNSHVSGYLSIEITESVALHDLKNTRRFIDKIRSFGARVALDDFGAGYTSFSYLKELPADLLKIDGSFVVNMNQHPANISIVEAIVNLARNLGMKTIAEWAEDAATVQTLSEIGVDYVQGFIVARPMAPDKLIEGISAASFIKNEELLQFVAALDRQNTARAQMDLLIENDKQSPPKIH